jgi:hypothetical protein
VRIFTIGGSAAGTDAATAPIVSKMVRTMREM